MDIVKGVLIVFVGYILGSVSFSVLLSRMLGSDIRTKGSGNAGATNMARVYGMGPGVFTLLGDMFKAGLAMLMGWFLLGDWGIAIGGMACISGHCFPFLHDFRGGKGISVGAAIGLAIDWRVFVAIIVVFLIVAFLSKKVSLGSICAAIAITIASFVFGASVPKLVLAGYSMCLAIFQHRQNIVRLIKGEEPDFRAAHSKK